MSRQARRYRRWERRTAERSWDDAGQLALDLYHRDPGGITPYMIGAALETGELIYRQVWSRYSTLGTTPDLIDRRGRLRLGMPIWRDWGWCDTLVTSHRLATRLTGDSGRLISNWWTSIAGVQVDLERQTVTMDDRTGQWRGVYAGPAVPIIAVAAIERIHGPASLADHPDLAPLRRGSSTDHRSSRVEAEIALPRPK